MTRFIELTPESNEFFRVTPTRPSTVVSLGNQKILQVVIFINAKPSASG
jgi:hypothetical protein